MDKNKEKLMAACQFVTEFFVGSAYNAALTSLLNFAEDLGIVKKPESLNPCGYCLLRDIAKETLIADILLGTLNPSTLIMDKSEYINIFDREDESTALPEKNDALKILFHNLALVKLQPDTLLARQIAKVLIDFGVELGIITKDNGSDLLDSYGLTPSGKPDRCFGHNHEIIRLQKFWNRITARQAASIE